MLKKDKKRAGRAFLWVNVLALALLLLLPSGAMGASITLSHFSSEETPGADVLDAILDFSVSDSILTLTAGNLSAYYISQIYFNAGSNITSLLLTSVDGMTDPSSFGWTLQTGKHADGFGRFDYFLKNGSGKDPNAIAPGDEKVFTFDISSTDSYSDTDFTTTFSTIPPGEIPVIVAAKFVAGPHDDGAYGASVPIPASVLLLGSVLTVLVGLKRRFARS